MSRYIDAEKLIAKLHSGDNYATILPPAIREIEEMLIDEMVGYVNEAPTEDVKPIVYGHWILADEQNKEDVENDNYRFICSECQCSDTHSKKTKVSYCWNCGADMMRE